MERRQSKGSFFSRMIAPAIKAVIEHEATEFRTLRKSSKSYFVQEDSGIRAPDVQEKIKVPESLKEVLLCPISQQIMTDPVVTPYGHTYDKEFIEAHLQNSSKDPLTGKFLKKSQLMPNYKIKEIIELYKAGGINESS